MTRGKKAGSKSKYEDAMKELARNERMKESKNELLQLTYFVSSFSRLNYCGLYLRRMVFNFVFGR